MTIAEIAAEIKSRAHDRGMSDKKAYGFISSAIREMESGNKEFNYQRILNETIHVGAGEKVLTFPHRLKRIITINELSPAGYQVNSGQVELLSAVTADTDFTVSYVRYHPDFDGTDENCLIEDDELLILGGTYRAMYQRLAPETATARQMFQQRVSSYYRDNRFVTPLTNAKWRSDGAKEALRV
ncbi:MAG: hypothetical protein AB7C95_04735 [Synergistaceae bacterium]